MGTSGTSEKRKKKVKSELAKGGKVRMGDTFRLAVPDLTRLLEEIKAQSFELVGPVVEEQAVVFGPVDSVEDLPTGYTVEQSPGTYRLKQTDSEAVFDFVASLDSLKKYLYPPRHVLWKATREKHGFTVDVDLSDEAPLAIIGVRACDLQAMAVQDRVLAQGEYSDTYYCNRRENLFIVAVNCSRAGSTCFCTSMDSGPAATSNFDLALTEIITEDQHSFVMEVGSGKGAALVAKLNLEPATKEDRNTAKEIVANTAESITRKLDRQHLSVMIKGSYDLPVWAEVGKDCLNCGNCTMVCPTCFCHTIEDHTDLTGATATRTRRWDSCFTMDFSILHGGTVRSSSGARYRQWMTHKLATWHDQFDMSGCVGCGRCITWCPVGIDITEVAAQLRQLVLNDAHAVVKEEI